LENKIVLYVKEKGNYGHLKEKEAFQKIAMFVKEENI